MNRRDLSSLPTISLTGTVDPEMVKSFDGACRDLFKRKEKPKKVLLVVTSTGGNIDYCIGLFERIRLLGQEVDLSFLALGTLMSAGITLMLAVPKRKRFTTGNTRFLIHNVQNTGTLPLKGTVEASEAQIREEMSFLKYAKRHHRAQLMGMVEDMTIPYAELKKRSRRGWYFEGGEAVTVGLVGSLLEED